MSIVAKLNTSGRSESLISISEKPKLPNDTAPEAKALSASRTSLDSNTSSVAKKATLDGDKEQTDSDLTKPNKG